MKKTNEVRRHIMRVDEIPEKILLVEDLWRSSRRQAAVIE
jgi:hypothetical protein